MLRRKGIFVAEGLIDKVEVIPAMINSPISPVTEGSELQMGLQEYPRPGYTRVIYDFNWGRRCSNDADWERGLQWQVVKTARKNGNLRYEDRQRGSQRPYFCAIDVPILLLVDETRGVG